MFSSIAYNMQRNRVTKNQQMKAILAFVTNQHKQHFSLA